MYAVGLAAAAEAPLHGCDQALRVSSGTKGLSALQPCKSQRWEHTAEAGPGNSEAGPGSFSVICFLCLGPTPPKLPSTFQSTSMSRETSIEYVGL